MKEQKNMKLIVIQKKIFLNNMNKINQIKKKKKLPEI